MSDGKVTSSIGYGRQLEVPFAQVLERARKALQAEGFGVLCEIDVREKMKEKLGVDFPELHHPGRLQSAARVPGAAAGFERRFAAPLQRRRIRGDGPHGCRRNRREENAVRAR